MSQTTCPHCGKSIVLSAGPVNPRLSGTWSQMRTMQSSAPWGDGQSQPQGYYSAIRKSPARQPALIPDVAVPITAGLTVGLCSAVLSITPAFYFGWSWLVPVATFGLVTPLAVLGIMRGVNRGQWITEQVEQEPPENPPASKQSQPVNLEIVHKSEDDHFRKMFRFELPSGIDEVKFYDFARGVTFGGRGLSQSDWTGSGSKYFSQPKYRQLLGRLTEAGIIAFIDSEKPTMGRKLTIKGRQALMQFVSTYEENKGYRTA